MNLYFGLQKNMEFAVAKALKPSLRSEFVFQQTLGEELFSFTANTVVSGEDFSVDDLLDFSNGGEILHHDGDEDEEEKESSLSLSSQSLSNSTDASFDSSIFSTELLVPVSFSLLFSFSPFCSVVVIEIEITGWWWRGRPRMGFSLCWWFSPRIISSLSCSNSNQHVSSTTWNSAWKNFSFFNWKNENYHKDQNREE